jgi:two-component sensor histidine kinase/PAS domain-containing protein
MANKKPKRWHWHMSIGALLLLRLLIVLAPIILLQTWVYRHEYDARREVEIQANLEVTRAVAASFDAFVADLRHAANGAGKALIYLAPFPRDRATSYMMQIKEIYPAVASVSWLQPNGLVFASSDNKLVNTHWDNPSLLQSILHGQDAFVTNVTRPRDPKQARFMVIQGARDATGTLRGIVVVLIDPNLLGKAIGMRDSERGTLALLDTSGWPAFCMPSTALEQNRRNLNAVLRKAMGGKEATGIVPGDTARDRRIIVAVPVRSIGWVVEIDRSEQEALAIIKARTSQSVTLFGLVTAIGLLLGLLTARTITIPLRRLRNAARVVGADIHTPPVRESGPAEVAELAHSFNQMAEEIRRRQEEQVRLLLEVQREQALLAAVIQHINHGVVAVEATSRRVLFINESFARIAGLELAVGTDFREATWLRRQPDGTITPPENWPPMRALTDGVVVAEEEVQYTRPDQSALTVLVSATPVRDAQGQLAAAVVSFHDITETRQAEQERAQLQQELLETERARAELAENLNREVSHRVKNNLAMIAGLLKMQSIQQENPELEAALRDATGRITTFASLFEEFQVTAGEDADLASIIQLIANTVPSVFGIRNISVSLNGKHFVYSRRVATNLAVVANELITNAIKHGTPGADGEVHVDINLQHEENQLYLRVWNSGGQVPADFDPTRQGHLGLRLVWGVATEQYGGTFSLQPHAGGTLAEVIVADDKLI